MSKKRLGDMTNKEVKRICDNHRFLPNCKGCPLKRTRYDLKLKKEIDLFCFVELKSLGYQLEEEDKNMLVETED